MTSDYPLSTVLLIDDDPTANYLHELLLHKTMQVARQVLVAENGRVALDLLTQACELTPAELTTCPQLILLDLNMPVLNGQEFLAAYQQLPAIMRQQSVVVVLTSSQDARDHGLSSQLPVADLLVKPLTRDKVADLLARHFPVSLS